jgi:hypothetical protein
MKFRHWGLILAVQAVALAADPGLLKMVMPDAKVVAGIQVAKSRDSLFGQFILAHMNVDDGGFKKFTTQTGLDPLRDVSEVLIASNWESNASENRWLVLARGVFDVHKIGHAAEVNGARVVNFQGVEVYAYSNRANSEEENGVAFIDASTALLGDLGAVKGAIERRKGSVTLNDTVLAKVNDVSSRNDFWFVTLVPVSEFAGAMPDRNLSGAMQGNLLAGISQASGGVRFGDTVAFSAEAVARSDKDAQALVDVVKFVASMVQTNRQNNATAGQVATLLDGLDCKATGNVTSISLAIPETQIEQMLRNFQQESHPARKRPPASVN